MKKTLLTWLAATISITSIAQEYNADNIKTVTIMQPGSSFGYPMCHINGTIQLDFDVIDDEYSNLSYSIRHCNADFEPDDLTFGEYADGFSNRYITEYESSFNTETSYTHYSLSIPNNDVRLTISGNYMVEIFEDDNPEKILLRKKFMVYEESDNSQISATIGQPFLPEYSQTHQQISVTFNNSKLRIANPAKYLKIYAMQNGNMESRRQLEISGFLNSDILYHQNNGGNIFWGINEFEFLDAKDTHFRPLGVDGIRYETRRYHYYLTPLTYHEAYTTRGDINGDFYIKNDRCNNQNLESDYIEATFRFKYDRYSSERIYIYGALSNYQLLPEYQMEYNPESDLWEKTLTLKQGLYNYLYAIVSNEGQITGFSSGSHHNTQNDYMIAVYTTLTRDSGDRLIMCKVIKNY
ncbi:MAG: DUF5103 domain-containing protein [Bacteroidales bacterium]|nr:DUF5103 domain-containing protein [Bacteroidales bacterium]